MNYYFPGNQILNPASFHFSLLLPLLPDRSLCRAISPTQLVTPPQQIPLTSDWTDARCSVGVSSSGGDRLAGPSGMFRFPVVGTLVLCYDLRPGREIATHPPNRLNITLGSAQLEIFVYSIYTVWHSPLLLRIGQSGESVVSVLVCTYFSAK